ncbi:MAG: hypothetical protein N3F09_04680, partial [Bacteroidia bacterium]|nr:hypothetical protein [Bacteroidia bacterium]
NVLCYNINQLVNYNSRTIIELPETKATMNRDMLLNITDPNKPNGISPFYEGLGFNSYLLDFDTVTKKYFSFSDTAIPVKLHRNLHRKGRINESTFSFAQSVGDEWYWGIGLGIQNIRFENELNHSEYDDQNKMQIITTGSTVSSTYITEPPYYYTPLYGFKQFTYTEYFKTTGKGYNVKGGIIYRHSPELRLGFYAHSPTFFDLSDDYNYYMKTTFDGTNTPMEAKYPSTSEKGVFNYSMKTPWKMGGSAGYIWNKKVALGLDAEWISYGSGNLSSDDFPSAFDGVNEIIRRKYKSTFNTRFGVEYNAFPYFFRAGYIQYGSPYGKMFRGAEVMNILTAGFGFRKTYFYVDFSYIYRLEQINYYPYTKTNELAQINAQTGVFQFSFGYKF